MQGGWGKSVAKDFTTTRSNKTSLNMEYNSSTELSGNSPRILSLSRNFSYTRLAACL